jgi:hypothetical protein
VLGLGSRLIALPFVTGMIVPYILADSVVLDYLESGQIDCCRALHISGSFSPGSGLRFRDIVVRYVTLARISATDGLLNTRARLAKSLRLVHKPPDASRAARFECDRGLTDGVRLLPSR